MDENLTPADVVLRALSDFYATAENPGMVTSFVVIAETARANGDVSVIVAAPDTQPYTQTLGLIGFGEEWVRDDMRTSFYVNEPDD